MESTRIIEACGIITSYNYGGGDVKIIRDLNTFPVAARGGAVAIGNFDGVHLGHVRIVTELRSVADRLRGPAIVFTFDPHPVRLLRPENCPPPLTWTERKAELLQSHGVDWMVAYPTDATLLDLSAADFFNLIVRDALGAKAVVEGPNFHFGKDREGDVRLLRSIAEDTNTQVKVVEPVKSGDGVVSSSLVRELIARGDVGEANAHLSAPYRLRGMVTHGAGRGATLGFPTANLDGIDTLLPAPGVYAGVAWMDDVSAPAAINIGPNLTFGENARKVEVHLVGRNESLYGRIVEVDFIARLRDIQTFASADALMSQLNRDVAAVRRIVANPATSTKSLPFDSKSSPRSARS